MISDASNPSAYAEGNYGHEGVYILPRFRFENGESLADMRVGYTTHGELNHKRDNAVLVVPGTGNTRHSFDGYIGPGKALDPSRYFIIAVDAIGAGTSSQPKDGLGSRFPRYSVRDMVHAQHAFLAAAFGAPLFPLRAVVGASMGAFQALEWAIHYPDCLRASVLIVPAARISNVFKTVAGQMADIVALDRRWNGGEYSEQPVDSLRAAGRFYYPWTVTDAFINSLSADTLARELAASGERFAVWDAWNLIRRYHASSSHDVAVPFAGDIARALANVRCGLLVMPTTTDRLLGVDAAREITEHVPHARYVEIPSACGHFGWRPIAGSSEAELISRETAAFLANALRNDPQR
jgi:homoserine O-acetyltransferase